MRIVLTGPAYLGKEKILRKRIITACKRCRITVDRCVTGSTNFLVASRQDTVKVRAAKMMDVPVITYDDLIFRTLRGKTLRGEKM